MRRAAPALLLLLAALPRGSAQPPAGVVASHHLADPIELTDGDATHRVTRVVVDFDRGTLTLERDDLTFDDYGDATRTGGKDALTVLLKLRPDGGTRFDLTTPFRQQLRVVTGDANAPRLVVTAAGGRAVERVVELRGPKVVPDVIGDGPPPARFHFGVLARNMGVRGPGLRQIEVTGSLAGGHLGVDPNDLMIGPGGGVHGGTLLGWYPAAVTFQELGPDPAKRGRRAFELVPAPADPKRNGVFPAGKSFVLVLGPTALSQHLLLVKEGGRVRQTLALRDALRDNHLAMLRQLDAVPAAEREAFRELGRVAGFRPVLSVNAGHIAGLHLVEGDLAKLDPILARLPHLAEVGFHDATLPPSGLPCLEKMPNLIAVGFTNCEVRDAGFASVGKAKGLKRVILFGTKGPTAAGLAHLAPLTDLEWLELRREDAPADAPNLDDGFKHLTGLSKLSKLNIHGQKITDAGLAHVGKLKALRELYLSGDGLTEVGLRRLAGLRLEQFTLYGQGSITPAALEAFRDTLPHRGRRSF